jgi:hypothetical protein
MNANRLKRLRNNPRKCVLNNIKDFNKRKRSCVYINSPKNSFINSVILALDLKGNKEANSFKLSDKARKNQDVKEFKRIREKLKRKALKKTKKTPRLVTDWIAYFKEIGIDIVIFQGNLHFKIFGDVNLLTEKEQIYLVRYKVECKRKKSGKKFKYDVVKNPTGYFQKGFLCSKCFKFSRSKHVHACRYACYMCKSLERHDKDPELNLSTKCRKCSRFFYGQSCKKMHVTNLVCDRKKFCESCFSIYTVKPKKPHWCKKTNYCSTCRIIHPPNRHYIRGEIEKPELTKNFLIFDFETFPLGDKKLETAYFCSTRLYTINYLTKGETTVINGKSEVTIIPEVDDNGTTFIEKNFEGLDCSKQFYNYLVSGDIPRGTICIAHNGQSFDFYFLIGHFFASKDYDPDVIINGAKFMQMKFEELGLKFIDSLNFIPFPLRKFPDLFGFSDKKTFFPHNFVNETTLAYNGTIPNVEEYGVKPGDSKDFDIFYKEECDRLRDTNSTWCLMDVAKEYCIQDVNVLFLGVFNYLKTFLKVTKGIDPFA